MSNVESITVDLFKSLLSYIVGSMTQSKKRTWSLVSKLIHPSGDEKAAAAFTSAFEDVDAALSSLINEAMKYEIPSVCPSFDIYTEQREQEICQTKKQFKFFAFVSSIKPKWPLLL